MVRRSIKLVQQDRIHSRICKKVKNFFEKCSWNKKTERRRNLRRKHRGAIFFIQKYELKNKYQMYDAYEKDVAVLNIFLGKSTATGR